MRLPRARVGLSLAVALIGGATAPVAAYGLVQLGQTVARQLSGPGDVTDFLQIYGGARLLLTDPSHLYAASVQDAVQKALSAGRSETLPFLYIPAAAVVLAPLGLLDYGWAYATWLLINLACLGLATYLLAPGRRILWLALLVFYLPVQFALIMGQTAAFSLLAFSVFVRLSESRAWAGVVLGCSPFAWKPQLLAAPVLALACGRRWLTVACALLAPVALSGSALLAVGPGSLADYRTLSAENWDLVYRRVPYQQAGQTLLGLWQAILQPGPLAVGLYALSAGLLAVGIGLLWSRGLHNDDRRDLQMACLPIAAVLVAPHALVYELTPWIASAWLLLRYSTTRPATRMVVIALSLVGWATANVVTLSERDLGFPLAVLVGIGALAYIGWLYRGHPAHQERKAFGSRRQ